ncbi:HNH endonuclease signature motif containing protein [Actinopolymorpha alba]|uniref:HNH endonuclease signature motif containing protein n=1 Tax=Actinopolymorpha alba TaxID=533267 RepID=UPI0003689832|nr:HNH endonuclease signature motif containing protein [Actinopolymorpha alba]
MFDHGDVDVLAVAAPGPELATKLAAIDLTAVNGYARVVVMRAWQRQASWASCRMYDAMAYVARSPMGGEDAPPELLETCSEFASVEIGAALTLSPGSADRELDLAFDLTKRLPGTRAALEAGRIDVNKAREISSETSCLSDELAREAEEWILPKASELTRQQLERRLKAKVIKLDPVGAEERRKAAKRERKIQFGAGVNGTASIFGYDLPLEKVAEAKAFINRLTEHLKAGGDDRWLGEIEVDVFLDLLRGRHLDTGGMAVKVELVAPLDTWIKAAAGQAGQTDERAGEAGFEPADLKDFGPISEDVLADLIKAAEAGFEYCWTVTADGVVVYHNRSAYRPTKKQREFVQARDRTCRHPGCERPAERCEADHTFEHRNGGTTCACNLTMLCKRHHRAKHEGGWLWTQPEPGYFKTQSPLGHTYDANPDPLPGGGIPRQADPEARRQRESVAAQLAQEDELIPF